MQTVVLVPGIMGSRLEDVRGRVWPPSTREIIFGYEKLDRLMGERVEATSIVHRVGLVGIYDSLRKDILRCGYSEEGDERRLIEFPYDWRRSNQDSAASLAERLDEEFDAETNVDDLDITILAHSMGGLVSRYLLESDLFTEKPWFKCVRRLVTLGTPHRGAPTVMRHLSGEKGRLGVSGRDIKTFADDPRFPSLYELAGPPDSGFATLRAQRGSVPEVLDPLGNEFAELYDLNAGSIAAAKNFWETLDRGGRPDHSSYLCVVGAAFTTVVRSELQDRKHPPVSIERRSSGDETVPVLSATLAATAHLYSAKKHGSVFEDRTIRETLYRILDAPETVRPLAADEAAEVGGRDRVGISTSAEVYEAGETIEVSLHFAEPIHDPRESFQIVEIDATSGQPREDAEPTPVSAAVNAASVESFSFSFSPELSPGLYELQPLRDIDDPSPAYFFVSRAQPG